MLQKEDLRLVVYSGTTDNQYNLVIVTARTGEGIDKMFGEKEIKGKKYSNFLKFP